MRHIPPPHRGFDRIVDRAPAPPRQVLPARTAP
jgi:hypothetical protein